MGHSAFRRHLRTTLRVLGWSALALISWVAFLCIRIARTGDADHAGKADAIIVLGAAVWRGGPSPAFNARIRHGVELHRRGLARKLIFTGGLGHDGDIAEAEIARRIAIAAGVPEGDILIEARSTATWENFTEAAALMRTANLQSAILVSDPYHLHRAKIMAADVGIAALASPTPYTVFTTWRSKLPFLLNEARLCHSHWWFRAIGKRNAGTLPNAAP